MTYCLNAKLAEDTLAVGVLSLCELRLMNNCNVLWLILIPQRAHLTELLDLSDADQAQLLLEMNHIGQLLQKHFPCDKLNIAMLGNVVSQLHVHVIARRFDDVYFPQAPFGLPGLSYSAEAASVLVQKLQAVL